MTADTGTALQEILHLADVPLELDIELGRKIMTVRSILGLAPSVVIKMDRSAGENIDVLAGGTRIGSAEIVVIEGNFGVRITDFREVE